MRETLIIFNLILLLFVFSAFGQSKKNTTRTRTQKTSQCQLTETPKLRGFFLGQTVDEFNKIIPNFKKAYEIEKERETIFSLSDYSAYITEGKEIGLVQFGNSYPFPYESGEKLIFTLDDDIASFEWFFYKDKLYAFAIYYADYDPPTAQIFAKQVAEKLNLPLEGWKKLKAPFVDMADVKGAFLTDVEAELRCNGFKVHVHTGYRNNANLTITDTKVEAEIIRLEKEIKERKKKEEQERIRREREKKETFKP